jgi:hypothetical protein
MKSLVAFLIILVFIVLDSCMTTKRMNVMFASVNNNVCRRLTGKVVIYAVFVDSKETKPWTDYDIKTTMDSLRKGMDWVELQAKNEGVPLTIQIDCNRKNNGIVPIYQEFSKKTLSATLYKKPLFSGVRDIHKWADKVAIEAGKNLPKDTSRVIKTKNKLSDRERLIARLRSIHRTDNIALMYLINNYHTDEMSLTLDASSMQNVEYSIVSYKYPSVFAHEFLHLFGAWDLYITPFDSKRKAIKRKKVAMELFPNEIMAFAYRNIESLEISPFTKYTIGWSKELDQKYASAILGRRLRPVRY